MPFLKGKTASPRTEFFYLRGRTIEAVRDGEWKLRYSNHRKEGVSEDDPIKAELYNMKHDPGEMHNVAELYPDIVAGLMNRMQSKAKEMKGNTLIRNESGDL